MSTHTIRLAGPWEQIAVAAHQEKAPVRCQLPALISVGEMNLLLARAFHRPTRLTSETRVEVVVSTCNADVIVRLNDVTLAASSEANGAAKEPYKTPAGASSKTPTSDIQGTDVARFPTGDCLREFNRLEVSVTRRSGDPQLEAGLIHVCLQIIEPSV